VSAAGGKIKNLTSVEFFLTVITLL